MMRSILRAGRARLLPSRLYRISRRRLGRSLALPVIGFALLVGCESRESGYKQAAAVTGGDPHRGRAAIYQHGCASCHTIPGVAGADALVGPSLEHVASRTYLGGVIDNNPDNLVRWILDPPSIDPKTAMPNLKLSESDARDIAGYLYTLK